jgi:hypothetical protein
MRCCPRIDVRGDDLAAIHPRGCDHLAEDASNASSSEWPSTERGAH